MLFAGAIGFVFAWTKSLPVSVGKPELRIVTHGIETIVLVPLVLWFGSKWDATGAAAAVLISTCVFAVAWLVALLRLHRAHARRTEQRASVNVLVVSGIWPPDVGRAGQPRARARRLAGRPRPPRRGRDHRRLRSPRRAATRCTGSRGGCRRSCGAPGARRSLRGRRRSRRRLLDRALSAARGSARSSPASRAC